MSMARLVAGVANGAPFAEPEELKAVGRLGVALAEPITVSIAGTAGRLVVPLPWRPSPAEIGLCYGDVN